MAVAAVTVSPEELREAIVTAVAAALTPEAMREVVAQAIGSLLAPRAYGDKRSQVQDMFAKAVEARTATYVNELLTEPGPLREQIDATIRESVRLMLADGDARHAIAKNAAGALAKALSGQR